MKSLAWLGCVGLLLAGCKSGEGEATPEGEKGRKKLKRPPRTATVYVDTKGEKVNAGGKKVEKADAAGKPAGSFAAKDLLMPGMSILVSLATAAGGVLMVKALDKKDRDGGSTTVISSGKSEDTYVPVAFDSAGSAAAGGPPAPESTSALAYAGDSAAGDPIASGVGVVATESSVVLAMSYSASFTGPSYVKVKYSTPRESTSTSTSLWIYSWELSVDRTAVPAGEKVSVFATFSELPVGQRVRIDLVYPLDHEFVIDHTPVFETPPASGLGTGWLIRQETRYAYEGDFSGLEVGFTMIIFDYAGETGPILLGHFIVSEPIDVFGESSATIKKP